jgi:hypothetical protein
MQAPMKSLQMSSGDHIAKECEFVGEPTLVISLA